MGENPRRLSQAERILKLLQERAGEWIPVYELAGITLQYSARVYTLRQMGHRIENKTERIRGAVHSWFRLVLPLGQQRLFGESDLAANQSTQQVRRSPSPYPF